MRLVAVAATLALAGPFAACADTTQGEPDLNCVAQGRCMCISASDCAPGQICVNGECFFVGTIDAGSDSGPDTTVVDSTTPDPGGPDVSVQIDIVEGGWFWPCTDDAECNSNKCIEGPDGTDVCTKTCIERCDPFSDWHCQGVTEGSTSIVFYCFPEKNRLCEPCSNDSSCPGTVNLCVTVSGDNRCGQDCTSAGCPTGYDCIETTSVDGLSGNQCVPTGGFCECTANNVGELLPCEVSNALGTCFGQRPCQDGGVLGACNAATAEVETCDGVDNDCNGFADDNVPIVACTSTNTFGTCTGEEICLAAVGAVCNAPEPAAELCDQLDNNCDGEVDEDFKNAAGAYNSVDHCGQCGNTCLGVFANAVTVICDDTGADPVCAVTDCDAGFVLSAGVCVLPSDHLCEPCTSDVTCGSDLDKCYQVDPTDTRSFCLRDCSPGNIYGTCPTGYTCQTIDVGGTDFEQCFPDNSSCDCTAANDGQVKPCANINADGQCFGVATCDPALGWAGCTALTPSAEVCDGSDNNCDGIIDEGLGGTACDNTNAFGTCTGIEICDPAAATLTCAAPDAAADDCDGQDNDCDGEIDEDYAENITDPGSGAIVALKYYLTNENCGGCGIACTANPPASSVICDGSGQDVFCRIEACDPGFYVHSSGTACLPVPSANLCLPCGTDSDCQGPDDQCLTYNEGGFCGRDCSAGSIYSSGSAGDATLCSGTEGVQDCCDAGFLCTSGQCRRESEACSCDVDGKQRPCSTTNAFGTCSGAEICQTTGAGAGWQACNAPTPGAEVCDGADNNCDGLVDQADPGVDTAGLAGYPDCQNVSAACAGTWACANVSGAYQWLCSAPQPAASEACNLIDDDCDGVVDEDYVDGNGDYTQLANCGQCGLDCTQAVANLGTSAGAVTCELVGGAPQCVPQQCASGHVLFPTSGTPSVCLPVSANNCQPCASDFDCGAAQDKCVSVGTDSGNFCAQRCDAAAPYAGCTGSTGVQSCCPAGFTCNAQGADLLCEPDSGTCQCSSVSDGLTRVCTATGNGGTTTCFGTETCGDQGGGIYGWDSCDLSANIEVCDASDNNCDGTVDEGFQTGGVYSTDEHCGQCGKNCALAFSAQTQHVFGVCDAAAPGGPDCAIGGCLSDTVGGGTPCVSDADCSGNPAGSTCLADRFQCGQTCADNGDCPGGSTCSNGSCTITCNDDGQCTSAFGSTSSCVGSRCVTAYTWVDLDTLPGNGCECAQASGLTLDEPETFATYPVPGADYVDRDCDGVDGDVASALFVAPGGTGNGTLADPYGVIQDAIDAFNAGSDSHILVATGVYFERITLSNGVKLYGGYSSDFTTRDVVLFPTVIAGVEDAQIAAQPGTVRAVNITSDTVVAGFDIIGYDVAASGTTSYTVYIRQSSNALQIVNNRIVGGQGAAGGPGGNGSAGNAGNAGSNGVNATECNDAQCNNDSTPGGAGGTNASCGSAGGCAGMESDGGEDPQVKDNPGPASGCNYQNGGELGAYNGGPSNLCKYDFNPPNVANGPGGNDGNDGGNGGGGSGCNDSDGQVQSNQWTGDSGNNATGGNSGTGGQGGSSGGWVQNLKGGCNTQNPFGDLGGTGGGGGAAGCGGSSGAGGSYGGGSFAVFIASSSGGTFATVAGNTITSGFGGVGGAGGNGGSGGTGGTGGVGGIAIFPSWGPGIGGQGGRGGDGGDGGGGGGGCGGVAYGIAGVSINTGTYSGANQFTAGGGGGGGGAGGLSAAGGSNGAGGNTGAAANVKAY